MAKITRIDIFLYGKPSWDMPIEGKTHINPRIFRKRGDELREHLHNVAAILEKLQSNGWKVSECFGAIYSLEVCKSITKSEAKKELKKLGISENEVNVDEFEDDE